MPSSSLSQLRVSRRTLVCLFAFLAGLLLWTGGRCLLYHYAHLPERALWKSKERMLKEYRYQPGDIVIIGSSRALALDPELIGRASGARVRNFSVGGATTPSCYYFLKRLLDANPGLRRVYLEFTPLNLSRQDTDLAASLGENFLRYLASEQEAAQLDAELPGSLALFRAVHRFPFERYVALKDLSLLEKLVIRWRTGQSDQQLEQRIVGSGGFFLYPEHTIASAQENAAFEERVHAYYRKISRYTRDLPPVTGSYFARMIGLLEERGVDYTIFFSPVPKVATEYPQLAFGASYPMFRQVAGRVRDRVLVPDNGCFSEPSHLNRLGSREYSRYFSSCVLNNRCDGFPTVALFPEGP